MRALDLFCGGGGATKGLKEVFDRVVGIDISDQPDYCGDHFMKRDVFVLPIDFLKGFDFIWASPTCQVHTFATSRKAKEKYTDQIPATRKLLKESGVPYCIENVPLTTSPILDFSFNIL